jgi:hypothetical protein
MFGGIGQAGPLGYSMLPSATGNTAGAQSLMGGMMSQGMATGAPMLGGMTGMLGMDPISLGMKAASMAWSRGGAGVLGAGMAGMATMTGVGVLGAGAAWAGEQMLSGAQQQMGLNRGLARNFNFMNAQGGQGFTSNQGFRIGEDVRAMTHSFGSGGEVATFSELSRLATNMGRMGMGQNVRTVKEFKDKFKQMVDSVKTIATELGTSLEEAQKMMASMKQVGVFKPGQAATMAKAMRQTALGGGLAMSEVSSMMNIGAQISQSVGGLGRAGATGGMKTIGQIGTALQMGALREEDVYNATGLSGAEGRQAFATDMMSKSADFLKSSRGRIFLASIAGRDGTLNEASAQEWMSGGVGVARTQQLVAQGGVRANQADFRRNEGRLRGAALERFGGTLQSMAYSQWLSGKGMDVNDMDDRAMLAFQRFSGLGRDKADSALKLVSKLPEITRRQSVTESSMGMSDLRARRAKTTGIEGMKRKLEQVREGVQGTLQQWGADLLESGTDELSSFFNKTMGLYEQQTDEAVTSFVTAMRSGGAMSSQMQLRYNKMFGGGMGAGMPGAGAAAGGGRAEVTGAQKYASSLRRQMAAVSSARLTGQDQKYMTSGTNRDDFRGWMTNKGSMMEGEDRIAGLQSYLKQRAASGSREDIMAYEQFRSAGTMEKAAMTTRMEQGAGIGEEVGVGAGLKEQSDKAMMRALGGGSYATVSDAQKAMGRNLIGDKGKWYGDVAGAVAMAVAVIPIGVMAMGEALANDPWITPGGRNTSAVSEGILSGIGDTFDDWVSGSGKEYKQAAALIQDEGFRSNVAALASGKGVNFEAAQDRLMRLRKRKQSGDLGEGTTDATELSLLNRSQAVGIADKHLAATGVKDISQLDDAQRERLLSKIKDATGEDMSLADVQNFKKIAGASMDEVSAKAAQQALQEIDSANTFERSRYEKMGVAQYKKVREATLFTPHSTAGQALKRQMEEAAASAGATTDVEKEEFFSGYKVDGETLGGMSPEKLEKLGIKRGSKDVFSGMELTAEARKKLKKSMAAVGGDKSVKAGEEAARLALAVTSVDFSKGDAKEKVKEYFDATKARDKHFAGMNIGQKRAFAQSMAGTEAGEAMAVSLSQHERFASLQKGQARKGLTGEAASYGAAAGMLGLDLTKNEAMALTGKGAGAAAEQVEAMLRKAGISDKILKTDEGKKFQDDVKKAMELSREGKTGEAAGLLGAARAGAPEEIAKALEDAETKRAARAGDPSAKIVDAINSLPGKIAGLINKGSGGDSDTPGAPPWQGPI